MQLRKGDVQKMQKKKWDCLKFFKKDANCTKKARFSRSGIMKKKICKLRNLHISPSTTPPGESPVASLGDQKIMPLPHPKSANSVIVRNVFGKFFKKYPNFSAQSAGRKNLTFWGAHTPYQGRSSTPPGRWRGSRPPPVQVQGGGGSGEDTSLL